MCSCGASIKEVNKAIKRWALQEYEAEMEKMYIFEYCSTPGCLTQNEYGSAVVCPKCHKVMCRRCTDLSCFDFPDPHQYVPKYYGLADLFNELSMVIITTSNAPSNAVERLL